MKTSNLGLNQRNYSTVSRWKRKALRSGNPPLIPLGAIQKLPWRAQGSSRNINTKWQGNPAYYSHHIFHGSFYFTVIHQVKLLIRWAHSPNRSQACMLCWACHQYWPPFNPNSAVICGSTSEDPCFNSQMGSLLALLQPRREACEKCHPCNHPYLYNPPAHVPNNLYFQILLLAYRMLWHMLLSPTAHPLANNDLPKMTW